MSQPEWAKHFSKRENRHYWYNAETKESVWEDPTAQEQPAKKRRTEASSQEPAAASPAAGAPEKAKTEQGMSLEGGAWPLLAPLRR